MRTSFRRPRSFPRASVRSIVSWSRVEPVVRIKNATFYRRQPSATSEADLSNPPIFPNLTYYITARNIKKEYWAVVGPSNAGKTTFLEILRGRHLCVPASARSFPYLASDEVAGKDIRLRSTSFAIQYVGFSSKERGLSGAGTYLSARYESRREATDYSVLDYLKGHTQLNAAEDQEEKIDEGALEKVVNDLRLPKLLHMPISNLSNGQTRRARVAKALLGRPELLLLDEPFMGLDPSTTIQLSNLLGDLAKTNDPRVVLALRPQDPIPDWITHILFLGESLRITHSGTKAEIAEALATAANNPPLDDAESPSTIPQYYTEFGRSLSDMGVTIDVDKMSQLQRKQFIAAREKYEQGDRTPQTLQRIATAEHNWRDGKSKDFPTEPPIGEPVIEMDGVVVKYGDKVVLGKGLQSDEGEDRDSEGLFWNVRRGQRWAVFGPNGSGKTTLLSLLTSDHPQAYSLPIKLFGRSRLPQPGTPGIPIFELQRRIGHSSPEIHAFFPRHLSIRGTLESAFAATPLSRPTLTSAADDRISAFLRWFQAELNPSAGMNEHLRNEYFRAKGNERKEFVRPTNPETYREDFNEYWYDFAEAQESSIEWADELKFGDASFSAQRVLLFLRAIVARPDIIVLDEAMSGLDDFVRDKCLLFLEHGEGKRLSPWVKSSFNVEQRGKVNPQGYGEIERGKKDSRDAVFFGLRDEQALVCVSHVKEELPPSIKDWIYLPDLTSDEDSGAIRTGKVSRKPLRFDGKAWNAVWDAQAVPRVSRGKGSATIDSSKRQSGRPKTFELKK